ncbi:MAG: lysophospholipid acyltransferase family protein [Planctomycetaceae bacterium]
MIDRLISGSTCLLTGAMPLWKGCGPDLKPRIYFANHTSHLDALVIWSCLPAELRRLTRPVAARDFWTAGRWRRYAAEQVFRAVLIERKKPTRHDNPIDDMLAALGDNGSLILFPEGGRHDGPDPVDFKSGLFHLAKKRPDVELVPVLLDNLNRILPKGEVLPLPLICSVTFGTPLRLETDESRDQFLQRARQAVIDLRNQD